MGGARGTIKYEIKKNCSSPLSETGFRDKRQYKCHICGTVLTGKSSWAIHITKIHLKNEIRQNIDETTKTCKICNGQFKRIDSAFYHVGMVHGKLFELMPGIVCTPMSPERDSDITLENVHSPAEVQDEFLESASGDSGRIKSV